jgi:hypothetical protein
MNHKVERIYNFIYVNDHIEHTVGPSYAMKYVTGPIIILSDFYIELCRSRTISRDR